MNMSLIVDLSTVVALSCLRKIADEAIAIEGIRSVVRNQPKLPKQMVANCK